MIKTLNIFQTNHGGSNFENVRYLTLKTILKYLRHPNILAIKEKNKNISLFFTFNHITKEGVVKDIKNLDVSKALQEKDIPTKIIKENADTFSNVVHQNVNNMTDVGIFPTSTKIANMTPIFKKGPQISKKNYRPVSILQNISTIYERSLFKQMPNYFENIFSKFHYGFRQDLGAKYCLISMTKKMEKVYK